MFGNLPFFLYICIMVSPSNEVIEYLYEKALKYMMPIMQMPATFPTYISKLSHGQNVVSSVLAFDRSKFEHYIKLLYGFIFHCKELQYMDRHNNSTIITMRQYKSISTEDNPILRELIDLIDSTNDDFIAYIRIVCHMNVDLSSYLGSMTRRSIEFSVGLAGFDIIDNEGKLLIMSNMNIIKQKWRRICIDKYYNDYSKLVGECDENAVIFLADYYKETVRL
jgi:hypothetical protein